MKENLRIICSFLQSGLIERSVATRLTLLAAISGEHILLFGLPGTAKSELARKLHLAFSDVTYFERLLTRFSVPEELFGPLSIKALENDTYQRLTQRYLPDASIAFIDEIFKANSAILNSLLTLLNEREFDNGSERIKTPLISVVAASNEFAEDESLEALYDRFLLRYQVEPVSDAAFDALLDLKDDAHLQADNEFVRLTTEDIASIQSQSYNILLDDNARQILHDLRVYLSQQQIYVSDRRWRKAFRLLQVSAQTNGVDLISQWDCLLLSHILWHSPDQIDELNNWFIKRLNLDVESSVKRIEKLVSVWESQLEDDSQKHTQKTNTHGEYLYKSPEGKLTTQHEHVSLAERDGDILYLAPPDQEDRTNNGMGYKLSELEKVFFDESYKQTHIDGRWVDVQNYINNTQNRLVERVSYEPVVETYLFTKEYVESQACELNAVIHELELIAEQFHKTGIELKSIVEDHLWLTDGVLQYAYQAILQENPKLIDFQQRLKKLRLINAALKLKPSHSVAS